MMFAKLCIAFAQSSLATARRSSGVNVPDQHVYKAAGPRQGIECRGLILSNASAVCCGMLVSGRS